MKTQIDQSGELVAASFREVVPPISDATARASKTGAGRRATKLAAPSTAELAVVSKLRRGTTVLLGCALFGVATRGGVLTAPAMNGCAPRVAVATGMVLKASPQERTAIKTNARPILRRVVSSSFSCVSLVVEFALQLRVFFVREPLAAVAEKTMETGPDVVKVEKVS